MSGLQDTLTKLCCCFDIEYGGFIAGVTRLVLHLSRVMIAIILLMGGIMEGIETTTMAGPVTEHPSGSGSAASTTAGSATKKPGMYSLYASDRKLSIYQMETMRDLLKNLAICWVSYYSVFFLITLVYLVGLKMGKWVMMTPMLLMTAVDIFVPPFLGSPGILFAYMMNDAYEKPAITLTILWESGCAIFGLYIFNVIWGTWLLIKSKEKRAN